MYAFSVYVSSCITSFTFYCSDKHYAALTQWGFLTLIVHSLYETGKGQERKAESWRLNPIQRP